VVARMVREVTVNRLSIPPRRHGRRKRGRRITRSVLCVVRFSLSSPHALIYDGLEFKEKRMLSQYVALKRRFGIATFASMATLAPALVLLLISFVSPKTTSPYLYLVFLAISIPFSVVSFRANSKLTELINSNDVRHVGFA
jgi:hypothetical protein